MKTIMLGVGDTGASKVPGEEVKTMALGSCVAVIFLDPVMRAVGMVHVALPESKLNMERAKERPGYFADTGIRDLKNRMQKLGCNGNMIVKLVGGAQIMDPRNTFNVGKRNVLAVKKILWQLGMGALTEDVGGTIARTVAVDVESGTVTISSHGLDDWHI